MEGQGTASTGPENLPTFLVARAKSVQAWNFGGEGEATHSAADRELPRTLPGVYATRTDYIRVPTSTGESENGLQLFSMLRMGKRETAEQCGSVSYTSTRSELAELELLLLAAAAAAACYSVCWLLAPSLP